jgi:glycosyltransferase involved in cell wall biosynthesis
MPTENTPEISVVIATYNRRDRLRRCLEALSQQTYDPDRFEVVVADDGSGDGTADMVESFEAPMTVRVLRLENGGWAKAANAGAEGARGRICLQIDDDIIASPQLVAEHAAVHGDGAPRIGIGRLIQRDPHEPGWFGFAYARAWNERFYEFEERPASWPDCYGANLSAPREALLSVGGFETDRPTVADMELGYRLYNHGCVPVFIPGAEALHDDEKPTERILRDIGNFGGFCIEFVDRHPETRARLLGWYGDATPREQLLRRALIALRVPPLRLAQLGGLIPGKDRKQVWYGFLARYVFWLSVRRGLDRKGWKETTRGVPVLMYHAFTADGERDRFVMPAAKFARQLKLLRRLRYRTATLQDLARWLREGRPLPKRTVVITIDDGYADNATIAQPLLAAGDAPATLFMVSGAIGGRNDWDPEERQATKGRPMLSREQLEQLRAAGVEPGAHTRTHRALKGLGEQELDAEVGGSRQDLEESLGAEVTSFAYPYGEFDEEAVSAVERAGLAVACTCVPKHAPRAGDPLRIPRLEIRASDGTLTFLRKLWLGGD